MKAHLATIALLQALSSFSSAHTPGTADDSIVRPNIIDNLEVRQLNAVMSKSHFVVFSPLCQTTPTVKSAYAIAMSVSEIHCLLLIHTFSKKKHIAFLFCLDSSEIGEIRET